MQTASHVSATMPKTGAVITAPEHDHDLTGMPIPCGECPESEPSDEHPFGVTVRPATWQIEHDHLRREFVCDRCLPIGLRYAAALAGFLPPTVSPLPVPVVHAPSSNAVCAQCGYAAGSCPVVNGRCARQVVAA